MRQSNSHKALVTISPVVVSAVVLLAAFTMPAPVVAQVHFEIPLTVSDGVDSTSGVAVSCTRSDIVSAKPKSPGGFSVASRGASSLASGSLCTTSRSRRRSEPRCR